MSTYEDDHNITQSNLVQSSQVPGRRSRNHQTLTSVIEAFLTSNESGTHGSATDANELRTNLVSGLEILNHEQGSELAEQLLLSLQHESGTKGITSDFFDTLERVDVKKLAPSDDCPICTNCFKDDDYPLVVKLPCSLKHAKDHMFDLDCIAPWLSVNSTCPLCRFDVKDISKLRRERLEADLRAAQDSEEEDEDRDLYG